MKTSTPSMIFENEISIKNMIKKVKEEGNNFILHSLGTAISCMSLFNVPNLKLNRA